MMDQRFRQLYRFLFFFSTLLIFAGCVKEGNVDRDPPTFEVVSFSPEPTTGTICQSFEQSIFMVDDSDTIRMQIEFFDEGGLSEAKIDIHNNFDCHGHRSQTQDWFLQNIIPLSGIREVKEIVLPVPENATSGNYHFGLLVSDETGNVTDQTFFYTIQIKNSADTIPPTLELISPSSNEISVTRGESLSIIVELNDDKILGTGGNSGIQILSRRSEGGNVITQQEVSFNDVNNNFQRLETSFTIPMIWVRDQYDLIIIGFDGVRNESNEIRLKLNIE